MKNYNDIDDLLKASLSSSELPSEKLNESLKIELRNSIKKEKEISIWWVPMFISIILGIIGFVGIKFIISNSLIAEILILSCVGVVFLNILMTFIGVKYFELKKGAKIVI